MTTIVLPSPRRAPMIVIAACLMVALAPWFSGGQEAVARVMTAGVLLLALLLCLRQPQIPGLWWRQPVVWASLGLLVWAALSLIWSVDRYDSVIWLLGWSGAVLAFVTSWKLTRAGWGSRLRYGYGVLAVLFSAYGLYLYFSGDYDRLTSSLYWANPAAAYLLPALVWTSDRAASRRTRRWSWPLALLFGTTFWLTQSRGATLILALTIVVLIWRRRVSWRYCIQLVFILALAFGLSTGAVQLRHMIHPSQTSIGIGSRFAEAASGESTSGSDRLRYLKAAGQIWLDHPIVGTGAGTYGAVHPRYQGRVISASTDAHNWYAQIVSELGLVGGLLIVAVMVTLIPGLRRGVAVLPDEWPWLVGIGAVVVHLGLDIDASYPAVLILVAVGLGLVWRPLERLEKDEPVRRQRPLMAGAAALVLVLAALINQSDLARLQATAAQADDDYTGAIAAYAQAQRFWVYDPMVVTAEGIDDYTLAVTGTDRAANLDLALERARRAERLAPTQAQNYQLEGRVLQAQGKLPQATIAFTRALKLDPYNEPSYAQDLAVARQAQGQTTAALAVTRAMLAQYPATVITNRSTDASLVPALVSLRRYQAFLEDKQGDGATSAADTAAAAALARSR